MSDFVVPGELLATSEELELVKGSYKHDSEFRSLFAGELEVDGKTRVGRVSDGPERIFSVGPRSIVRGMVSNVMDNVAVIKVFEVEGSPRSFLYSGDAILLVSMASQDFVESLKALFKIGDIVRVKVSALEYGVMKVVTKFPEFGVIQAFCGKCRKPLNMVEGKLKCGSCGRVESRKVAVGQYQG